MAGNISQDGSPIGESSQVGKSSGATRVNVIKHQFTWTISNFSYSVSNGGQAVHSPVFTVGTKNKTRWYLAMYPKFLWIPKNDSLGLFLAFLPGAVASAKATCRLSIINDKNMKTNVFGFTKVYQFSKRYPRCGWDNFGNRTLLQNPSSGCLRNDSLTICCDLTVIESIASSAEEGVVQDFVLPASRLFADFVELYEKPKLTDVTIVTRSKEFPAHKAILAARSPYFSKILELPETVKEQNNRVYDMDVCEDVLKEVLRFIYTGGASVDKMADKLLVAADKYQLRRLKGLCEKSLVDNIAVETAVDRLIISEHYGAAYLKKHALQFIRANASQVMATESYKALHYTHPNLIDEALQAFAATKIDSKSSVALTTNCWEQCGNKRKRAESAIIPPSKK